MTISAGGERSRRVAALAAMVLLAGLNGPHAMAGDDYATIKTEAEKLVAEGSYALAHQTYLKAKGLTLGAADQRWLDFRLADTLWRSQAGTQTADETKEDQARQQLHILINGTQRPEDRDRAWCEAQESLADFWWTVRHHRQWITAWTHYKQALDWWAGSPDTGLARPRYIAIVRRIADPPGAEPYYYYGYHGNFLPPEIIRSALKIAQADADKASLRYLLARSLQHGNMEDRAQAAGEFEAVLKFGKTCDWYDDTLYYYGEWMAGNGAITRERNGNWRQESDYVKALELFRRLAAEFQKGETRFYELAQSQIASILAPSLGVSVPCVYLPGSEVQFQLNWRNMKEISLPLYKVDLTRAVDINASTCREPAERLGGWTNY